MGIIKIGCDPENFLSIGGKAISAAGLFPGTKKEPFKVEKGAIQVDGVALEFNIDPAETPEEYDRNIDIVLGQMKEMAKLVDKDIVFNFQPYMEFDQDYWTNQVDDLAKVLGCDGDYSATSLQNSLNPNPMEVLQDQPIRTAAGHVHIGWTHSRDTSDLAHFNDCKFVANGFHKRHVFSPRTEEEHLRLKYYGAHGAFRPKPYGVELRSPSNLWVKHPETRRQMFVQTVSTFKELTGL